MSAHFRNLSRPQSFLNLRTRPKRPSDGGLWQNIYPAQVSQKFTRIREFAVANWVPVVVGVIAGIGAAVGGFYIGEKYSTANVAKKLASKAVDLLPKKIQEQVKRYM